MHKTANGNTERSLSFSKKKTFSFSALFLLLDHMSILHVYSRGVTTKKYITLDGLNS